MTYLLEKVIVLFGSKWRQTFFGILNTLKIKCPLRKQSLLSASACFRCLRLKSGESERVEAKKRLKDVYFSGLRTPSLVLLPLASACIVLGISVLSCFAEAAEVKTKYRVRARARDRWTKEKNASALLERSDFSFLRGGHACLRGGKNFLRSRCFHSSKCALLPRPGLFPISNSDIFRTPASKRHLLLEQAVFVRICLRVLDKKVFCVEEFFCVEKCFEVK